MSDNNVPSSEDDLVTLVVKPTEFEAKTLVAVLEEEGIKAVAFGAASAVMPLGIRITPVPVQVRRADLDRAKAALQMNIADSVDLDWDEVDVGPPDTGSDSPVGDAAHEINGAPSRRSMPLFIKFGYWLAMALILLMAAMFATSLFKLLP
jgi:hypothetical protein